MILPEAFELKMKELLGGDYEAFRASFEQPKSPGLRLNPLKTAKCPELPFLESRVEWAKYGWRYRADSRPGLHVWHDCGLYYMQEPSAMAPVTLLDPQPGERVLDLCAAPGGKTTQIGALMGNKGLLVTNEIVPNRAAVLARNVERMGITNALVLNEHPAALAARFAGFFDRVLVDAPCSGEGMFRREETAVSGWSSETVAMCAERQHEILSTAAVMLSPGGRLVYSTCTFAPEEDEGTISRFLTEHPDFEVERVQCPALACGRPEWIKNGQESLQYCFRLWPYVQNGEGHFAAVLRKKDGRGEACRVEPTKPLPKECEAFLKENIPEYQTELSQSACVLFGERVYVPPVDCPSLQGLKVLRAGLEVGSLLKGRFEPAHALAMAVKTAASVADFAPESGEIARYLRGETLPGNQTGWTLVQAGGLSLGWGKASGGVVKNHYPKGLRR